MAKKAVKQRKGAPIFFIDIAVPRDVDPAVNQLPDVYAYDIDDLQAVTDANKAEREREALLAQRIVEEEIDHYEEWRDSLSSVPTIKALRRSFEEIGEREVEKSLRKLTHLSGADAQEVRKLAQNLINKLLHTPSTRLRQPRGELDRLLYGDALNALFDLRPDEAAKHGHAPVGRAPAEQERASGKIVQLPLRRQKK